MSSARPELGKEAIQANSISCNRLDSVKLSATTLRANSVTVDGLTISDQEVESLVFSEASAQDPPGTGKGRLYVKDDVPSRLYFIDDAGSEFLVNTETSFATPTLDTVLVAGDDAGGQSMTAVDDVFFSAAAGVQIGETSAASGGFVNSVAVGSGASTDHNGGVAIGTGATCRSAGGEAIAIGEGAQTVAATVDGVAIGKGASSGNDGVAFGTGASTVGTASVAVGHDAYAVGTNCVVLGAYSTASGNSATVIGANSSSAFDKGDILGSGLTSRVQNSMTTRQMILAKGVDASRTSTDALELISVPVNEGEVFYVDFIVSELNIGTNQSKIFFYKGYHFRRLPGGSVVMAAGTASTSDPFTLAASTVTFGPSGNNIVATIQQPDASSRAWDGTIYLRGSL